MAIYKLIDANDNIVFSTNDYYEARLKLLVKYCTEELPRLMNEIEEQDLIDMIIEDKKTAYQDTNAYIQDYLRIEESIE